MFACADTKLGIGGASVAIAEASFSLAPTSFAIAGHLLGQRKTYLSLADLEVAICDP